MVAGRARLREAIVRIALRSGHPDGLSGRLLCVERSIDRGTPIRRSGPFEQPRIFSDLIALHLDDLSQVGKPVRRSKSMVLKALKISLGRVNLKDITREKLIEFGRKRASEGAGPATLPAAQV